ncbi:MAG: pilus assembly protein PilM [Candidatus Omnitrophota bacterium]
MEKTSKILIGIDIGEYSIKAVKIEKTASGLRILDFITKDEISKNAQGEIDPAVIKDILNKFSIEGAQICSVISGGDIVVKHAIVPFMPKEELKDAVRWSLKEVVNFNLEESKVDFQIQDAITGTDGIKRNEVLAVAVNNAVIDKNVKLLQAAGIEPYLITTSHFALANLVAHNERIMQGKTNVLIDIGFKKTTILIFRGTKLEFIRQISSAGDSFTKALSGVVVTFPKRIELDFKKAQELIRQCGIPSKFEANANVQDVPLSQISVLMRPVLERFLTDVRGSFKYFREEFQVESIDQIFLSGSGAMLKNLVEFVKDGLGGIPTQLIPMPERLGFQVDKDKLLPLLPALSVSIGACLGEDNVINLVPKSVKMQKSISVQQRILSFAGIILLIIVPFTFISLILKLNRYKRILISYNDYYSNLVKLRTLRDNIVERQKFFNEIIGREQNLFLYLKELSRIVPSAIEFRHLEYDKTQEIFLIQGLAYSAEISSEKSLSNFLLDLENSPYFSDVNLISSKKTSTDQIEIVDFVLSVKLTKVNPVRDYK